MRAALGLGVLLFAPFFLLATQQQENRPDFPKQLVINGERWNVFEVEKVRNNPGWLGYADCRPLIIEVRKNQTDWEKADTLIHESMHAMTRQEDGACNDSKWDNDSDDDEDTHPGIYWGAGRIADFIADNPSAVKYVQWARSKK